MLFRVNLRRSVAAALAPRRPAATGGRSPGGGLDLFQSNECVGLLVTKWTFDPRPAAGVMMKIFCAILGLLCLLTAHPARANSEKLPMLDLQVGEDAPALASFIRFAKRPGVPRTPQLEAILSGPLQPIQGSTIHFGPPATRTVV